MKTEKVLKKNAIKAYKVFSRDLICRDFQYEIGKTYRHSKSIQMCSSGFHACQKLIDCFRYCSFCPTENRVAEVLVWGDIQRDSCDTKVCASRIHIIRELSWQEVSNICNTGVGNTGFGNYGCNNSGKFNIGSLNTGDSNTGNYNTGGENSGDKNTGSWNTGHYNTGNWNSGNCNTGNYSTGNCNTGKYSTGSWNSGYGNSGNCNSGNWNSGNYNTGYSNSGDWNAGNWNSGKWNAGNWNAGYWNAGIFNTGACEYTFAFNQPVKKQDLECFPDIPFLCFSLVEWIPEDHMLPEEKKQHPEYATTGGYLKKYTYKEAFRKSFEAAKKKADWPEQLKRLKALPNFDAKIFEEISGIKEEELGL